MLGTVYSIGINYYNSENSECLEEGSAGYSTIRTETNCYYPLSTTYLACKVESKCALVYRKKNKKSVNGVEFYIVDNPFVSTTTTAVGQ